MSMEFYRLSPKDSPAPPRTASSVSNTTAEAQQQFEGAVDQLWCHYQGLMVKRVAVLQSAAQAAQTGTLSAELRQASGQEAHKLAGVLGMFNREDGTRLAQEIEQLLEQTAPDPDRLATLVQALTLAFAKFSKRVR